MTAISLEHSGTSPAPAPAPHKRMEKMPSGWYIVPCAIMGLYLWYVLIDASIRIFGQMPTVIGG